MPYVFISYSHDDSAYARRLAESLEQKGLEAWIDDRIDYGAQWPQTIQERVDRCSVFLVVMTPRSEKSRWVQNELHRAQRKGKTVFPLLLEGDCWISVEATQWVNVSDGKLPPEKFYADVKSVVLSQQPRSERPAILTISSPIRLELVRVPAGAFLMGSDPKVDKAASSGEQPQHRLTLPEFHIGKYPVPNEQYAAFVKAAGRAAPGHWKKGQIPAYKADHPVVNVTWQDAMAFCRWLSQASGHSLRLPTEAEWEKAARGGDGRIYPWGKDSPTKELCNFAGRDTTPVGQYPAGASPCGALDMAGNVWEWTSSLWGGSSDFTPEFGYPYDAEDGRENLSALDSVLRVLRGGSFRSDALDVRGACRGGGDPYNRDDYSGFRVVSPGF